MHERERRGGGLQRMALMVAREVVVAREAGVSPVMAREANVAREDPVALMRPGGSVALGAAPVASTAHGSGGVYVGRRRRRSGATANWGDGDEGEGFGEEVWRPGDEGETAV